MSFSYNGGANPPIDYPRLLIPDAQELGGPTGTERVYVFDDSEIMAAYQINSLQWQSGFYWSGPMGSPQLPTPPTNYLRCAALLLNSIAGNNARLLSVAKLLDVQLQDPQKVVAAIQATAQRYLDMDDNSGAFFIAEQCTTSWGFIDRYWRQIQRQSGGCVA